MIVLIIASIIALLCVYLKQRKKYVYGLEAAFIITTILAAIHYDFGPDYMVYYGFFNNWTRNVELSFNLSDMQEVFKDPGWVILCLLFKPIGFFGMVAVLSVVQNYIYYSFIKKNVPINYWTLAFFIYVFTMDLYPMNMSMMRQGLAVALFVYALPKIFEKKWLPAILPLLLAISIHKTALALLPFLLLGFLRINRGKVFSVALLSLFLFMVFNRENLGFILKPLDAFEDISEKLERSAVSYGQLDSFGVGFALKSIPFVIGLWYIWKGDKRNSYNKSLVSVASIGFLFIPLAAQVYMLQRMYIYFQALTIATVPVSYSVIKEKGVRLLLYAVFVFMTLLEYSTLITAPSFARAFSEFHTIFEVL